MTNKIDEVVKTCSSCKSTTNKFKKGVTICRVCESRKSVLWAKANWEGEGMREIKFRAKRIDNGKWVYGHYFVSPLTQENVNCDPKDGWFFLTGKKRHCIESEGVVYEIDINTLGQFTGLLDKNGKEIYGGDVLRIKHKDIMGNYVWSVEWANSDCCFVFQRCSRLYAFEAMIKDNFIDGEILGNIYENPELLNPTHQQEEK